MTINIIYDYQVFSLQRYGGISRYYYEIANRVDKTPEFNASIVAPLNINEYLKHGGVNVKGIYLPVDKKKGSILTMVNQIIAPYMLRFLQPDVIHETYYSFHTAAPRGCPIVITVYDMIHENFPEKFLSKDNTSDAKRAAVMRADHVICISEQTRKDLIAIFNIKPEKTTVIYLGYSLRAHDGCHFPDIIERPFLLYVGERGGYKNFDMLLQAYASSGFLRREFVLVAFGGGAFTADEINKQRKLGLDSRDVQQLSGADELLAELYRQASAFIYPSLYEGFGIPPLEAMSYDCPVICSNTSSIPEVVGNSAWFFDPYHVEDIRTAIESVIMSDRIRNDLIISGRERLKHFSWDQCAAETMKIYKKFSR